MEKKVEDTWEKPPGFALDKPEKLSIYVIHMHM